MMQRCTNLIIFSGLTALLILTNLLFAQKKPISDVLYRAITEDGIEAALKKYDDFKANKSSEYDFSEVQLNNLGYRLLGEDKSEAALEIFKLNVKAFPESPNTYDSLGEAFMKTGDTKMAILNYEKVLAILPKASINEQQKQFLKQNAEAKLHMLRNPEVVKSNYLEAFLTPEAEYPFGKLHPDAPPETEQWGQLAGVWECTNFAFVNGQWFSGWKATWAWRYILDGFAVQDVWHQKQENLPPPRATLPRDFVGTNIRIYDRVKQKWQVMWFHNGQLPGGSGNATSQFEAEFIDGQIIMTPVNPPASGPQTRNVFYNITKVSFEWKSETLNEDGETWTATFKIKGKRLQ